MQNNITQFRTKQTAQQVTKQPKAAAPQKDHAYFDYTFFLVMLILIGFGLVMVYSASYYEGMQVHGDAMHFLKRQALAVVIGFVGMAVVWVIPHSAYRRLGFLPYIACIAVILLVIPFGVEANGARRWIDIGPVSFQAVEPVKVGLIVFLANFVYAFRKRINTLYSAAIMVGSTGFLAVLILKITDNMSSALILCAIAGVMLFVANKDYKWFVILAAGAVAAAAGYIMFLLNSSETAGFRSDRILAWLDLEAYAQGKGYQTLQSLYAIGSGGIWGKGLCQSIQKLNFLPEAQNDMIFSIICEELGLFGGICVIVLFGILIWRMVIIATHAPDLHGAMLVVGVIAHIAVQVILNIAVVTSTIPNTGISLPFISYGGTSISFLICEMGLVMSVARSIRVRK